MTNVTGTDRWRHDRLEIGYGRAFAGIAKTNKLGPVFSPEQGMKDVTGVTAHITWKTMTEFTG